MAKKSADPVESTDNQTLNKSLKERRQELKTELAEIDRQLKPQVESSAVPRIGGTFAPPLNAEKLESYKMLADSLPEPIKTPFLALCEMVEVFQETPRSNLRGNAHPSGKGTIIPLEEAEIKRIWDHVPWDGQKYQGIKTPSECDAYAALFDQLHPVNQRDLRNAAFHLLWFAKELSRDREPLTTDQL